ncbi:nuclear valosin-containing protein-like [Eurosta solidaginis]|uniref:nuclear valosin-containing protein-like n=1 Tax=Eurosta solidaginis TaxID=178769 RepID=UPI003530C80E
MHGPPGSGKTLLAHAIAGQLNLPLIDVAATELIAGMSDESEERIRDVFEQAPIYAPSVLFNDEIDANHRIMVIDEIKRYITRYIERLHNHPNPQAINLLDNSEETRRLQRLHPLDLPLRS